MNDKELGNAVDAAKRELDRALLVAMVKHAKPMTVTIYVSGSHLDLELTADDVRQAAERQLAALPQG